MAEFDQIFANDPNNPQNVAENGVISIYAPGTRTLLALKTVTGGPLSNPLQLNSRGFGPAFIADGYTLVAWEAVAPGEVFNGFFKSYEGVRQEAVAAKEAAQTAASTAGTAAVAVVEEKLAAGEFKGEPGKDGSNVATTRAAVAGELQDPASPSRAVLSDTVASEIVPVSTAGVSGARLERRADYDFRKSQSDAIVAKAAGRSLATTNYLVVNGENAIVQLPPKATFDTPMPLLIHHGGLGNDAAAFSGQVQPMIDAARQAGFIVATAQFHGPEGYGSPDVMRDVTALYEAVLKLAPVNGIIVSGESMGGVAALNSITTAAVPSIMGCWLAQPVVSLRQRWENGRESSIRASYGVAADGSDYALKTAGYDPALRSALDFRGIPFFVTASPEDSGVPKAQHADVLVDKLAGYSPVTVKNASGGHGDMSHFITADFVNFLKSCVGSLGTPPDPTLIADFDAATLGLANGAPVASWSPSSGAELAPLAQATTTMQPTYVLGAIAGKPAVSFDADDWLDTGAWAARRNAPTTVVEVFYRDPADTGAAPLWTGRNGVYSNAALDATLLTVGSGTSNQMNTPVPAAGAWHLLAVVYDGASSKIYIDSATPIKTGTTGGLANSGLPGLKLSTDGSSATTGSHIHKVARLKVLGRAITAQEITLLAAEYGIALNPA